MTKYGYIVANTRPYGADIYIDGQPIYDTIGSIIRTPTLISNIVEGLHSLTFRKIGFDDITVMLNVTEGLYSDVGVMLNTSQFFRYPMMLSLQDSQVDNIQVELFLDILQDLQPAPGWPAIPSPSGPYGHIVANTNPDGADIYIDGQPVFDSVGRVATTPSTILNISTGIHRVTFRKQGYFDENIDVLIQNGLYSDVTAILRLRMAPLTQDKWYMEPEYLYMYDQYQLYPYLQHLQPKQRGAVHFDTQPHGADIIIDGQILIDPDTEESIKTPATVLLFEGRRDFFLKLEGHHEVAGYVDVFPGSRVDIFRNLEPIPGSNIRSMDNPYYPGSEYNIAGVYSRSIEEQLKLLYGSIGDILIDSDPQGAYVYIDGYPQMDIEGHIILTPVRITGIAEGMHEIQISIDGHYSKKIIVNIISNILNHAYAKLQAIY